MIPDAFRLTETGLRLFVRLTPRGGRDAVEGWARDAEGRVHLKVRVSVPPEGGKANAALVALLARELRIARSDIAIVSGETARLKQVDVTGARDYLQARLEAWGETR